MGRRSRILAALFAAVALVFAQLAMAAYACPSVGDLVAMAQMQHDAGDDGAVLCEQHCKTGGKLSFEAAKPAPAEMPALAAAPALRVAPPPPADRGIAVRTARLSIAGPEPPFGRFTVLRI